MVLATYYIKRRIGQIVKEPLVDYQCFFKGFNDFREGMR